MQQGGVRGALALLGAVLGVTLSLFKLAPEVSRYDFDDVARVIYLISYPLSIASIYFWGIAALVKKRLRHGTLLVAKAFGCAGVAWWVMFVLVVVLVGPPVTAIDTWTAEMIRPAVRWIASLSPPIFAVGGYVAYRGWMGCRSEREQQCPWCREWVKRDARKCRYCGSGLGHQEHEPAQEQVREQLA
jgi:hypothetical protein